MRIKVEKLNQFPRILILFCFLKNLAISFTHSYADWNFTPKHAQWRHAKTLIFSPVLKKLSVINLESLFSKIGWKPVPFKKKLVHLVYGFRRCRYKYLISYDRAVRAPQGSIDKDVCMIKPFEHFMLFESLFFLANWLTIAGSWGMEMWIEQWH